MDKESLEKEINRLTAEVERLRAVLEGAGYQSIDNLKNESVEKCKSIGLTAKLLTEREITARVDMTSVLLS